MQAVCASADLLLYKGTGSRDKIQICFRQKWIVIGLIKVQFLPPFYLFTRVIAAACQSVRTLYTIHIV